jgi:transcription-repair coupling factor (superfamily II helicase)
MPTQVRMWIDSPSVVINRMNQIFSKVESAPTVLEEEIIVPLPDKLINGKLFSQLIANRPLLIFSNPQGFQVDDTVTFNTSPQPLFHKHFPLLEENILERQKEGYSVFVLSGNSRQLERLRQIFTDKGSHIEYQEIKHALHEGFVDHDLKWCIYTDHQIFDRYHKFTLRTDQARAARQAISIKEISRLNPGDYVVHADHGVGRFGGLVTTEINGKKQEAIQLIYRDNDVLLISIHSLHRISKFKGQDSEPPRINKLGSGAWQKMKEKTKKKVKDIARELIGLYARRKTEPGFAFSHDSYLQNELEASFMYEDTPDQVKATIAVKSDMEASNPMDRLVCGDVGFGKTEIAVRAAFKAVADNKQVALLVPTTILAFQHFRTFSERLKDFPCRVEYVSRLRKPAEIKKTLEDLKTGKVDILIGTHRLTGKDVSFKDLGLLIVDEEQRFGVSIKEKLKQIKVNVDTLTLTATPIPRTLQFSLMGARDLSILNTPPPNRHPIVTELHTFNEEIIKEAILYEVERNGQVFFINNRIHNIAEIETMLRRILPNVKTIVAHGQMEGEKLESIMLDFIDGDFDVLIATTIIESGLDIPNANTIIINNAHQFGLSELHQLRGRVGRSNKKAFCYLLAPPITTLTNDARKRLRILEEFSELGSGFNIAMQDLDIRGAGNILGAEQSGYIADIGYETYQRILQEALLELRESEYPDLETKPQNMDGSNAFSMVADCQIETDVEVRFPEEYINNIAERMDLYRDLDNIDEPNQLDVFRKNLTDRFGELPTQAEGLLEIVKIRIIARTMGIEKLILKNNTLRIYFISNSNAPFYKSSTFESILKWLQAHPKKAKMEEKQGKLLMIVPVIRKTSEVLNLLSLMKDFNQ